MPRLGPEMSVEGPAGVPRVFRSLFWGSWLEAKTWLFLLAIWHLNPCWIHVAKDLAAELVWEITAS
eukprot:2013048-Pyramimonas_sp.AAC.1